MWFSLSICMLSSMLLFFGGLVSFSLGLFFSLWDSVLCLEWELTVIKGVSLTMSVIFDSLSFSFLGLVFLISSMVIYYSENYMEGDKNLTRFILLVLLFVGSMMFLIVSPNMVSILLGWDGLGLVSYGLVIYYQNDKSASAGMLTALSNRVGDVAILLSIAWMMNFGDFNYIYYQEVMKTSTSAGLVSYFVVLAAMTKSAQIPFSAWLPAAMAAPTPVSALVHSSTLVTAGVYMMIRFHSFLQGSYMNFMLILLGTVTMLMSGLGANFENDLKKIIALSTLSQLVLMMSVCSLGYPFLAYLHLLCHAMFKALLFMCAGVFIHGSGDNQDIRNMGAYYKNFPFSMVSFYIANMALCGAPFLSGFYSKDLILEIAWLSQMNFVLVIVYCVATGCTVMYTIRLILYMAGQASYFSSGVALNDSGVYMVKSMLFMTSLAVVGGSGLLWCLAPSPFMIYLSFTTKLGVMIISCLGAWAIVSLMVSTSPMKSNSGYTLFSSTVLGSMWFLPWLSTWGVTPKILMVGGHFGGALDQGWSEFYGAQGMWFYWSRVSAFSSDLWGLNFKLSLIAGMLWLLSINLIFS